MGYLDQIEEELRAGDDLAKAVGEVPVSDVLNGPLRPAAEIFGAPSEGSKGRVRKAVVALNLEKVDADSLTNEAWLRASLNRDITGWEERLPLAWRATDPRGPSGDLLDVVAQAVQIRRIAERLDRIVSAPVAGSDKSLVDWASQLAEVSSMIDRTLAAGLGLQPLLGANCRLAAALVYTAGVWGNLNLARSLGRTGRPQAVPSTMFVWWLRAAGATPKQIAAVDQLTGSETSGVLSERADRIGKIRREDVAPNRVNPARFLALMAQQEARWATGRPEDSASVLPPPLGILPGDVPKVRLERDWLWIPTPSVIVLIAELLARGKGSSEP